MSITNDPDYEAFQRENNTDKIYTRNLKGLQYDPTVVYLRPKEVAAMRGVAESTVRLDITDGVLRALKKPHRTRPGELGTGYYIHPDDILNYRTEYISND